MPDIVMFVPVRKITNFIIALLGAGWPDHKNYKWHDTLELLNYGNSNYEYRSFWQEPELSYIPVENGILNDFGAGSSVYTGGQISVSDNEKNRQILIGSDDRLQYQIRLKEHLSAPVRRGEQIGQIIYLLNDNNFFPVQYWQQKTFRKIHSPIAQSLYLRIFFINRPDFSCCGRSFCVLGNYSVIFQ